jgi:hypothetical protein
MGMAMECTNQFSKVQLPRLLSDRGVLDGGFKLAAYVIPLAQVRAKSVKQGISYGQPIFGTV